MKLLMLLGAVLGFVIVTVAGWLARREWPLVLVEASVAALVGGYVLRWWGQMWVHCLRQSLQQRAAAVSVTREAKPTAPLRRP